MLGSTVARPKRDQAGVFSLGQRHPRLGDALEPCCRGVTAEHCLGIDSGEVPAPGEECGFGGSEADHQRRRQERCQLRQSNGSARTALGDERRWTEPRRLGPERGSGIGEIADHRGRNVGRNRDGQGTRQFRPRRQAEGDGAPARQDDPRRRPRDFAQPVQIVFGYELGGDRKHADLIIAYQHRLAAAERSDGFAEAAAGVRLRPCDRASGGCCHPGMGHPPSPCGRPSYGLAAIAPAP